MSKRLDAHLGVSPVVACWHDQDHLIFHERFDMKLLAQCRTLNHGELNVFCRKGFQHLVRVAAHCGDSNARVLPQECSNQIWKEVLPDCLRCPESQGSSMYSGGTGHHLEGFIRDFFQLFRIGQKRVSRRS
jgi:hypothetical protein